MQHIFEFLINRKLTAKDANKHRTCEYEVVDLDLPSGLKWATCYIGANSPGEPGLLFQWGRTDGYKYGDDNHRFLSLDDYTATFGNKYKEGDVLKPEDDAAYEATNGELRMPTEDEIYELVKHTNNEWTKINGIKGRKFISKKDKSNWIFIPAGGVFRTERYRTDSTDYDFIHYDDTGFIWCSTLSDYSTHARDICFKDDRCHCTGCPVVDAISVRGVYK